MNTEELKMSNKRNSDVVFFVKAFVTLMMAIQPVAPVWAAPQGEQVVSGDVSFSRTGDLTQIQAGHNSIINYSGFDILSHETVQFIQPNAMSRVLNRVQSIDPTHIDGSLLANGRVYITNPAGVYFGHGAFVDVGAIYAAAGNIANEDFLRGIDHFTDVTGAVVNSGAINAEMVGLIGSYVANQGSITADDGVVMFLAGEDVYIGKINDNVFVKIVGKNTDTTSNTAAVDKTAAVGVENSGSVRASGGNVTFGAGDLYSMAIRTTGKVQAEEITIDAGAKGTVLVSGSIDASEVGEGGAGGNIRITGEKVGLFGADVDASGDSGGGTVLIGGDYQGKGELPTAETTYVSGDSTINADAAENGDGGKVIVWADGKTSYFGEISARGGANGGDGGFVEVSGKKSLTFAGKVDTRAPRGETGTLLLDPTDIEVVADAHPDVETLDPADINEFADADIIPDPGKPYEPDTKIGISALETAAAGSNVILQAENDITFNEPVSMSNANSGITAQAGNDITVNQSITTVGGDIAFSANDNSAGTATGTGSVDINAAINTNGGSFTSSGDSFNNNSSGTITATGGITISNDSATLAADLDGGAGLVSGSVNTVNVNLPGSIQDGINIAADGATVAVAAGAFNESLSIERPVTLRGSQVGNSVDIRTAGGAAESTVTGTHRIPGGTSSVTMEGFSLDNSGGVLLSLDSSASGAISDITFRNNFVMMDSGGVGIDFGGNSVSNDPISNVTITDCEFIGPLDQVSNPIRIGGWFGTDYGVSVTDLMFRGNNVTGGSIPVYLNNNNITNLTLNQNEFVDTDGVLYVWANSGAAATSTGQLLDFEFTENTVGGSNSYGLGFDVFGDGLDDDNFDLTGHPITISYNKFDGIVGKYGFGAVSILSSDFTGMINAERNWWGNSTGPDHAGNPHGTGMGGSPVSDHIDFTPWYATETVIDSGNEYVQVEHWAGGDVIAISDTITDGIGAAVPSVGDDVDELLIQSGAFNEHVIIDKNVQLRVSSGGTAEVLSISSNALTNTGLAGDFEADDTVTAFNFSGTVSLEDNVSLTSTGNGSLTFNDNVTDSASNSLTVDTGSGGIDLNANVTANGGLDLNGGIINVGNGIGTDKVTSNGAVVINATGTVTINAEIDPTTVNITSEDDVDIAAAVMADDLIDIRAGTDNTGSVLIQTAGSLETLNADSDVNVEAGQPGGSGAITLDGLIKAIDQVTLTAHAGAIEETGIGTSSTKIEAAGATLTADTNIGVASLGGQIDTKLGTLTATAKNSIVISNTGNITLADVKSTVNGDVFVINSADIIAEDVAAAGPGRMVGLMAGNDIEVHAISAPDTVMLIATGSITDGDNSKKITTNNLDMNAAAAIGADGAEIDTEVNTLLNAIANGGGIYLSETDGLTINNINANGGNDNVKIINANEQGIGLGDAVVIGGLNISGADLGNISANVLELVSNNTGVINVDNIAPGDDATITALKLTAGDVITFENNPSAINALTATAGNKIDVNVELQTDVGNLVFESTFEADHNLKAAGSMTLEGAGILDGTGLNQDQVISAGGTLLAKSTLTKNTTGELTLSGGAGAVLENDVVVNDGGLTITSDVNAEGLLEAEGLVHLQGANNNLAGDVTGIGITFDNAVTADGAAQTFDAGTGTLLAQAITKTTAGKLTLGGDTDITLAGNVTSGDDITLDDNATATGGVQTIDAGAGTLSAKAIKKTTAGKLTLGGDTDITLAGNVTSNDDITLADNATATGGVQTIDAGAGTLSAQAINKTTAGKLTLGGDTDIILAGNITSNDDVTLDDDATATGGTQTIDAGAGTLSAQLINKTTAGKLTLGGDTDIALAGDVTSNDDITLDNDATATSGTQTIDAGAGTLSAQAINKTTAGKLTLGGDTDITLAGDVTSNDDITLADNATATGGVQTIDAGAGTLSAQAINKTTAGKLTLGGDTDIALAGDVTSNDNITLDDNATATGGVQTIDAGAGTLSARAIAKTTAGELTLGGDTDIALAGDVTSNDDITLADNATATGGVQTIDAGAGTLSAKAIAKTTAGKLTLGGDTSITLAGNVTNGNDITLDDNATVIGGTQTIDAGAGKLSAKVITKTTAGKLTLGGDTDITLAGNVTSNDDITLDDDATATGGVQTIDAGAGTLSAKAINKTTAGKLTLGGNTDIVLAGNVTSNGDITLADDATAIGGAQTIDAGAGTLTAKVITKTTTGKLTLGGNTNIVLAGNVTSGDDITLDDDATATGGTQTIDAGAGKLSAQAINKTTAGKLTLGGNTDIALAEDVTSNDDITLDDDATATGGTQTIDAGAGTLSAQAINKTTAGKLTLGGDTDIILAGDVTSNDDITFDDGTTAIGGVQTFDAGAGKLEALNTITKTSTGDLTLSGSAGVELASIVDVQAGDLTVTDPVDAEGLLQAGGAVELQNTADLADNVSGNGIKFVGAVTADGSSSQTFNAGTGKLEAQNTITKNNGGGLTLSGVAGVELASMVDVQTGNLTVTDAVDAEGLLQADGSVELQNTADLADNVSGNGIKFVGAVTANGGSSQTFNAGAGKLEAQNTITKNNSGGLTLSGVAGIELASVVDVRTGSLTVTDAVDAEGLLQAGGSVELQSTANLAGNVSGVGITFNDAVIADGGTQTIDAGTGTLSAQAINKTTAGKLTLSGDTNIILAGNVTSGDDITLDDDATATSGTQTIDAGAGTLSAQAINKTTAGKLTLSGDTNIILAGNITNNDDITLDNDATATGGVQTIDSGTGTLSVKAISKTTAGKLTLSGDTGIALSGNVISIDDITIADAATATGGVQAIDAGAGTLTAGVITKTTAGKLTLGGDTGINPSADITSNDDITLDDMVTATGGNQKFDAGAGTLTAKTIEKNTAGLLTLGGADKIELTGNVRGTVDNVSILFDDAVTATGDSQTFDAGTGSLTAKTIAKTTSGNLSLAGASGINLSGNVSGIDNVTFENNVRLEGSSNQSLTATNDKLYAMGTLTKIGSGDLTLAGGTGIELDGTADVQQGSLIALSSIAAEQDLLAKNDLILNHSATLTGWADQQLKAAEGKLETGQLTKTIAGELILTADEINLSGAVANHSQVVQDVTTSSTTLPPETNNNGRIIKLQPGNTATAIRIGGSDDNIDNLLELSEADLENLQNGFGSIIIGLEAGTSAVVVDNGDTDMVFSDPVIIQTGGTITVESKIKGIDNASVELKGAGSGITLNAGIYTDGQAIRLYDSQVNGTEIVLDTTSGPQFAGNYGQVILDGPAGEIILSPDAGKEGTITLNTPIVTTTNSSDIQLGADLAAEDVPETASIYRRSPEGGLSIETNGGDFTMGQNQKITVVDGDLLINTDGGNAGLGDLNANGRIEVEAGTGTITLLRRTAADLMVYDESIQNTRIVEDSGLDFVAKDSIVFTAAAVELGGNSPLPQFSSMDPGLNNINGQNPGEYFGMRNTKLRSFPVSLIASLSEGGSVVLDLEASGVSTANAADALAGVLEEQRPEVSVSTRVNPAQMEQLARLNIYAKEFDSVLAQGAAYTTYDDMDLECKLLMSGACGISPGRLSEAITEDALRSHQELFYTADGTELRTEEINKTLQADLNAFRKQSGAKVFDPAAFHEYLETSGAESLRYLNQLNTLITYVRQIGLTSYEYSPVINDALLRPVEIYWGDEMITTEQLKNLIKTESSTDSLLTWPEISNMLDRE